MVYFLEIILEYLHEFSNILNKYLSFSRKGCRDIFTLVLEKSKDIPDVISQPDSPQIEAVLKVTPIKNNSHYRIEFFI
jgi:hypothetical protein